MPVRMKREDLDWLLEVRRLSLDGLTQAQVAERMGISHSGLRTKVASLGFQLTFQVEMCATLGGTRLVDLIERGDLVAAEDNNPAPAQEPIAA